MKKSTKILATLTAVGVGAAILSRLEDRERFYHSMKMALLTQSEYICDLENFIIDIIGEDEFAELVGPENL